MRIFNIARRYKYQEENTGEGGEGSAGNGDANNDADKVDDFSNVWHNEDNDSRNSNSNNEPTRVVIDDPNAKVLTPQEKLSAHIDSLNLADGFNTEALNDPKTALAEMQRMQAATYAAAMKDTNTLIQQAVGQVRDELTQQTQDTVNGNQIINKMNSELVYTKSPAYKPVADSLLTQFQNKGQTPDEAIASVGKYFAKMAGDVNATMPQAPNNRMQGNSFKGNNQNQPDGAVSPDWIEFMTASNK